MPDLPRGHWWISNNREGISPLYKYIYMIIYICIYINIYIYVTFYLLQNPKAENVSEKLNATKRRFSRKLDIVCR